jgi:hypothetical protein
MLCNYFVTCIHVVIFGVHVVCQCGGFLDGNYFGC